ncbi:TolC family protein [Litoribacillus peritrichatus]|uniref:TolC family protein n=1 Tax=Litoribacillus peritrichatus TaxID=718191 RepID=A0ABP7M8R0_9GAMM
MVLRVWKQSFLGASFALILPSFVLADMTNRNTSETADVDMNWSWFSRQIEQHPEIMAIRENMNAEFARSEGMKKPTYNPELSTDWEREGEDNNYSIGLSQTVDWSDKQEARIQQSKFLREGVKQRYELALQEKAAEGLTALIGWQVAKQQSDLALAQEVRLSDLLSLIQRRQQTGDLGEVDAELAYLGLSQTLNLSAKAQAELKQARTRLQEVLPEWKAEWTAELSEQWIGSLEINLFSESEIPANRLLAMNEIDQYPSVLAAKADWTAQQEGVELIQREISADPTFGISTGVSGEENVIGLSFSIPLHVRNDYSDQVRASNSDAISAEANYLSVRRKQQFALEASLATLNEYQQRFERWQKLAAGRAQRSADLLERYWRSGDMSTAEYVLALEQRSADLTAGIELQAAYRLAKVDWLLQTASFPFSADSTVSTFSSPDRMP